MTNNSPLTEQTVRAALDQFVRTIPAYPRRFRGRGIVVCGGGRKYFPCAWVCINLLRRWGCSLPIQLWHLGSAEADAAMRALLRPLGVECVDAWQVRRRHPARILNGWEVKPYAILHSPFEEVLCLDADNVPVLSPEFLFDTPQYRKRGAIFWPDFGNLKPPPQVWEYCGLSPRDEPDVESGQLLINKKHCWRALQITMWMNEHSDFFYQHIHGDKETFHLGWRKAGLDYALIPHPIQPLPGTMCQHDFQGRRIFQHRNMDKWSLFRPNETVPDFLHEAECRALLEQLRRKWTERASTSPANRRGRGRWLGRSSAPASSIIAWATTGGP